MPLACPVPPPSRAPGPLDACAAPQATPQQRMGASFPSLTALLIRPIRTLLLAITEPGNGDAAGTAGGLA